MMRSIFAFLLALLVSTAAIAEKPAPESTDDYLVTKRPKSIPLMELYPALPKHVQQFISSYEQVKQLKDENTLESIIHPASLACENERTKPYFDHMRQFYLNEELPMDYEFQLVPVATKRQEALKERLNLPVAPTHVMYIEFRDTGWQRFLREETEPKKRIYEIVRCPDEAALKALEEEQKAAGK